MKNKIPIWKSIQFRFLLMIIIATACVIGGLVAFTNNRTSHNLSVYNDREAERKVSFANISTLETQSLKSLTIENTYWDEMVSFIAEYDQSFESEILESQLDTYDADVMWTYDKNFNLVSNTNKLSAPYENFNLKLSGTQLSNMFKSDYLTHFYRNTDIGILEVYGASVHPSSDVDHKTPPQGYFFIARILDDDYIKKLEVSTDDEIRLITNVKEIPNQKNDPKSGLIAFGKDLMDENNTVVGQLRVEYYAEAIASLFTSLNQIFIGSVLFLTFLFGLLYGTFKRIIVDPLAKIYKALLTDDLTELEKLKSNQTELGNVADLIDKSIRRKQEISETAERIRKAQQALESRTQEIEKINNLMIDRELKMIELKAEIKKLKAK